MLVIMSGHIISCGGKPRKYGTQGIGMRSVIHGVPYEMQMVRTHAESPNGVRWMPVLLISEEHKRPFRYPSDYSISNVRGLTFNGIEYPPDNEPSFLLYNPDKLKTSGMAVKCGRESAFRMWAMIELGDKEGLTKLLETLIPESALHE